MISRLIYVELKGAFARCIEVRRYFLPAGKKSVLEGIEKQNFVDVGRVFCITSKRSRSLCNGSEKVGMSTFFLFRAS